MKNIVIIWFVLQMIVLGIVNVNIHNEVVAKTYDCQAVNQQISSVWPVIILPLAVFIPDSIEADRYCGRR